MHKKLHILYGKSPAKSRKKDTPSSYNISSRNISFDFTILTSMKAGTQHPTERTNALSFFIILFTGIMDLEPLSR